MVATLSEPSLPQLLQRVPLLAGLAEHEFVALAAAARADRYDPEITIFNQGDPCDRFWILRAGQLKIVHLAEDGREIILEVISPDEVFGGAVLFMAAHPATARTLTAAQTLSFPSETYARLITQHPAIAQNLIRMLGARLHSVMALQVLAGERVERRLAHILLKLASRAGRVEPGGGVLITIPLTRQDLAEMAGTTLETTIRTLSRFRAQGWLETRRGGYILIRDPQQLQAQVGA
jgi:CRP/FNR family transcriptional regulator, nitrogen oxide reductase regulator